MRSPALSARLTASIETGRLMVSGSTLRGNATASRRGSTGNSEGRTGEDGSAMTLQEVLHGICFTHGPSGT